MNRLSPYFLNIDILVFYETVIRLLESETRSTFFKHLFTKIPS